MLRLLVAVAAAAVTAGAAAADHRETGARTPRNAAHAIRLLTVTTSLPAWRAPGVPVEVGGFAGSHETVRLRVNGVRRAATLSGPLGRYRLRFTAARPGSYRLAVESGRRMRRVGALLVRRVVVHAVGDITFGEQVGPAIEQYGPAYPWTAIAPTLRAADITAGNLETAVSDRGIAAVKEFTFRGPPNALTAVARNAGFDVLSLANNHAVDYGREALLDTLRHVRAAGIQPIGAGADSRRARRPAIVEAGGLRVAFLGYSDVNPPGFVADVGTPGTARADSPAIAADIRAARRRADVVVCFFHWGTELHADPDGRQKFFAAACLNAGAKLVLGAHPHVLGPVTRPWPSTVVAWTLGNFVFPSGPATSRTAVLRVELDRSGVRRYRLLPVQIDGFRPRLARS